MTNKFAIDKQTSLDILHNIFSNLKKLGDVSIHHSMEVKENITGHNVIDLRHSISIVTIDIDDYMKGDKLEYYENNFYDSISNGYYCKSRDYRITIY